MLSITYFRRCWYIHQYRKNRNQIIDIKFHIDSLLKLEKVNEQLHQANKARAPWVVRKCYRSGFNHRLKSIRNSLKHITENMA